MFVPISVKSRDRRAATLLDFASHGAPHDIVLAHGAGGNNLLWKRTLQGLSGPEKAFAVNLPGHPVGEITCHTVGDYVEALHDFIVEGKLTRPVVCGHSMGGAIALALSLVHPDDIGGLVLVSTGAKLGVDPTILEGLEREPMRTIENNITPHSFNLLDLGLAREARTALSLSNLPVFRNDYLACQGFDVRKEIERIGAKTAIFCGDKDWMTPPKWSHYLRDHIPDSEAYFVKDSGHMLPLEKPETLARLLQSFLGGLTQ
jgi:pimeloyl-ACP methyl ester carboxylesterase